jgi:hypothetical protein
VDPIGVPILHAVVQPVVVGVRIVRVGEVDLQLLAVGEPVAVRVPVERVGADVDFLTVAQPVAVRVRVAQTADRVVV